MKLMLSCPWCRKKGIKAKGYSTFGEVEAHLEGHGDKDIEDVRKQWDAKARILRRP